MKKTVFISILLLALYASSALSQNTLEVICHVENSNSDPIISAKAELYEDGNKIKTINTDSKGKISFILSYNKSYKIIISKKGMIHKRIDFKTDVATENQRNLRKEFAMTLVDECEGADVSAFKEPADIITFDEGFGNFVSDRTHFEKMQSKFAKAYSNLEKCKQDKFQDIKNQADEQFSQGNFEEAIDLYEEALKVFPNDGASKRQISQANKSIIKQQANNQRYEQVIKEADLLLAQNSLSAAKQKYAEAARLNSNSAYPQEKLNEIQKIITQQTAEDQKRKAASDEYNNLIKQGNAAIAAKNFPVAKQLFEKAVIVKPNDVLATQKIAEAQQALQRQEQQQAESARINKAYQEAIAAAGAAMQQSDYIKAQELYQSAIALKPSEALARQKLVEAQKLEAQKQKNILAQQKADVDKSYNNAIANASEFLSQKLYPDALTAFEQAMVIKPSDKYAQQQIVKINNLIIEESQAKQVAIEQKYSQAISLGDSKKLSKEYSDAILAYKQALQAKPNNPSATAKLEETQKLLADKIKMDKDEQETRVKYNELIQEGDGLFSSQDYKGSKIKYEQASILYFTEQYPKNQLSKIENIVAKNQQEAKYNSIIADADGLFNNTNWKEAKVKYGEAALVLPDKTYPRQKINEINQNISSNALAAITEQYNKLATQAEQLITQKNYEQAKNLYSQAQQVQPENQYPQQRINEINQLISDDSKLAVEVQYNKLTGQAEQLITQKGYEQAKSLYAQAQQVQPENPYPQQRINEINQMIDNDAKQGTLSNYNNLISQADAYFNKKEYNQAKSSYNQAQVLIPTEQYPQQRINEINQLVSNNTKQMLIDEYNSIIANADNYLSQQNYNEASNSYRDALAVMPEQEYPRQKLNEINAMLTEQARINANKSEVENNYKTTIALADKYFNDKNYPLATNEYNRSLRIKTGEQYPSQQIEKIKQLISNQQQLVVQKIEQERRYNESIVKADEAFKLRDYTNAKITYNEALGFKPGDIHANSQLQRIDQINAEKLSSQQKQQQRDTKYKSLIANADNFYSANKLKDSRLAYLSALEVIPGQDYPRSRIRKIDEKLRIIAANQAAVKTVTAKPKTTTATEAVKPAISNNAKLTDLKFTSASDKKKYFNDLKAKFNEGVTKEMYADRNSTTNRYIVIRNGEVKEFREIIFKWGGAQYRVNGKPTNSFYLNSQVKPRDGESYKEVKM